MNDPQSSDNQDSLADQSFDVMENNDNQSEVEEKSQIKVALTNAEKQKRYRERQKARGKKELRGYLSPEALECYEEICKQTQWSDSVILSNALRLTFAAYKNGQVGLLNRWLTKNKL